MLLRFHLGTNRFTLVATLGATVLLICASAASAIDFCIDTSQFAGNPEFRAFDLRLPKAGRCRSFVGHRFADADGGAGAHDRTTIQGVACTPSNGTRVDFTLVAGETNFAVFAFPRVEFHTVALHLPDLVGDAFKQNDGGGGGDGYLAAGYYSSAAFRP